MANPADRYAQKTFGQLESQMSKMYREAYKDVSRKLADFTRKHKVKDKQMRRDLKSGKITQGQYDSWLRGQVFIGEQWRNTKASLELSIKNVMTEAAHLIYRKSIDVFVDNANYTAYQIEGDYGFSGAINFTMYDRKTVSRLMLEDPELLPRRRDIDGNKLEAWNTKTIANCITQGILQGEGINELSKRIARDTCVDAERSSLLYARTAMTGAQNAGRVERMHEAEEMGIKVQKQWMSTLDSRTRDTHREMDGEIADTNSRFSNGLGYPGDPTGDPREVYNCRCTLTYHYPEYSNYANMERTAYYEEGDPEYDPNHRRYETVKGMNYEKWSEYKQDQIRQRYGGEQKPTPKPGPKSKDDRFLTFDSEEDNRRLEEQRKENKQLDEEQKKLSTDFYKTFVDEDQINKEDRELDRLEKLSQSDYSMFDRFQTEEDLKQYRNDLTSRIEKLKEEADKLTKPRRDDYSTEEAYERAFDEYLSKKISTREKRNSLESDLYRTYNNMPLGGWSKVEEWRNAKSISKEDFQRQREDLERRREKVKTDRDVIRRKQDEVVNKQNSNNEAKIVDEAKSRGVEFKAPEKYDTQPSIDEIVSRLGGGDETDGSCASLGFCYIGQKNGIDVLDFRDGESRTMFSHGCRNTLRGIAQETGKPLLIEPNKSGTGGAVRLIKQCQPGKEYYFVTGRHAAIVRKVDNHYEYLELQSAYRNGWKQFGEDEYYRDGKYTLGRTFEHRFGCSRYIDGEAMMMDIDDMKDSKVLQRSYGYMNTAVDKQHKGATGHER